MSGRSRSSGFTDVFVAQRADAASPGPEALLEAQARVDCFRLHRVQWQETRRSADGRRLICRFRAPDAESVRVALRLSGIPFETVWTSRD